MTVLAHRTSRHKEYIVSQFQWVIPGFNPIRVTFGAGVGYAVRVMVGGRHYFSHDGAVFHYIGDESGVPTHSIEFQPYKGER
jgi:hypothetical protein